MTCIFPLTITTKQKIAYPQSIKLYITVCSLESFWL